MRPDGLDQRPGLSRGLGVQFRRDQLAPPERHALEFLEHSDTDGRRAFARGGAARLVRYFQYTNQPRALADDHLQNMLAPRWLPDGTGTSFRGGIFIERTPGHYDHPYWKFWRVNEDGTGLAELPINTTPDHYFVPSAEWEPHPRRMP